MGFVGQIINYGIGRCKCIRDLVSKIKKICRTAKSYATVCKILQGYSVRKRHLAVILDALGMCNIHNAHINAVVFGFRRMNTWQILFHIIYGFL